MVAEGVPWAASPARAVFTQIERLRRRKTSSILVLDYTRGVRPKVKPDIAVASARPRGTHDVREPPPHLVAADDRGGAFAWRVLRDTLAYSCTASVRSPTPSSTSTTACAGDSTGSSGPFEVWDALGVAR